LINKKKKEYGNLTDRKYFEQPKILLRDISYDIEAVYDDEKYYSVNTLYSILLNEPKNLKYVLGVLNSQLLSFYFRYKFEDAHVGGEYLRFKKIYSSQLPIKKIETQEDKIIQDKIIDLVDEMLKLNKTPESREKNKTRIEAVDYEIDKLVYGLYGLDQTEIEIIKNK
jgi:adenine-specific DNA-methyltransferase